jgi:hypothetical protein
MIRLSAKQLAMYMTSNHAQQRTFVRKLKYPDEDVFPPGAYYRETRESIVRYHRDSRDRDWLNDQATELEVFGSRIGGNTETRLDNNARLLRKYSEHFGDRRLVLTGDLSLRFRHGNVAVSAIPELYALERKREKVIKLDLVIKGYDDEIARLVAQIFLEAADQGELGLRSSNIEYVHVLSGTIMRATNSRSRILRNVEAASDTISAIYDSL